MIGVGQAEIVLIDGVYVIADALSVNIIQLLIASGIGR